LKKKIKILKRPIGFKRVGRPTPKGPFIKGLKRGPRGKA